MLLMEETEQLWPLRCRDRLVEPEDVASDGAQICGQNLWTATKFCGRPQKNRQISQNFTKKSKIDVVAERSRSNTTDFRSFETKDSVLSLFEKTQKGF